jgi:hypothetical protein
MDDNLELELLETCILHHSHGKVIKNEKLVIPDGMTVMFFIKEGDVLQSSKILCNLFYVLQNVKITYALTQICDMGLSSFIENQTILDKEDLSALLHLLNEYPDFQVVKESNVVNDVKLSYSDYIYSGEYKDQGLECGFYMNKDLCQTDIYPEIVDTYRNVTKEQKKEYNLKRCPRVIATKTTFPKNITNLKSFALPFGDFYLPDYSQPSLLKNMTTLLKEKPRKLSSILSGLKSRNENIKYVFVAACRP